MPNLRKSVANVRTCATRGVTLITDSQKVITKYFIAPYIKLTCPDLCDDWSACSYDVRDFAVKLWVSERIRRQGNVSDKKDIYIPAL